MITLEIACNNLASALNAQAGGADRIELFENILEGGCTPSYGMIKTVKESVHIPVYVMIRPRGGNFIYSKEEIKIMHRDIEMCASLNVDGIVLGALTAENKIDHQACKELIATWGKPTITFHRAIDCCDDLLTAAHEIIQLGCERILSSGGAANAWNGRTVLQQLQSTLGHQIHIMAGAGVTAQNVQPLIDFTKVKQVHATCKTITGTEQKFKDMSTHYISDPSLIKTLRQTINAL